MPTYMQNEHYLDYWGDVMSTNVNLAKEADEVLNRMKMGPGDFILCPGFSVNLPLGATITKMFPLVKYREIHRDSGKPYDVQIGVRIYFKMGGII